MDIIINKIAIWKRVAKDGLLAREMPDGTPYRTEATINYRQSKDMLRYVKNYEVGGIKYSLFVRTTEKNQETVEAQLDAVAARLTEEYVKNAIVGASITHFVYTDFSMEDEL